MPVEASSVWHGIVIAFGGVSAAVVVVVVVYWLVAEATRTRPDPRTTGLPRDKTWMAGRSESDSHHER